MQFLLANICSSLTAPSNNPLSRRCPKCNIMWEKENEIGTEENICFYVWRWHNTKELYQGKIRILVFLREICSREKMRDISTHNTSGIIFIPPNQKVSFRLSPFCLQSFLEIRSSLQNKWVRSSWRWASITEFL